MSICELYTFSPKAVVYFTELNTKHCNYHGDAIQSRCAQKTGESCIYERGCSFTILRNSKHHQRRFNFLLHGELTAIWKNLRAQLARNKRERYDRMKRKGTMLEKSIGDKGARRCRWCCGEERWRMIGRISQCTRSRQSRKTDDRPCIDYPRTELSSVVPNRFLLKGIPSKGKPWKSRLSKHRTSTIRYSWISRRITSNNVASELKIDVSPKGTAR